MAKKNKGKLQKLITKEPVVTIASQANAVVTFAPKNEALIEKPTAKTLPEKFVATKSAGVLGTHSIARDLRWSAISLIIIILCLGTATLVSKKTGLDDQFGNWLYQVLRLNG